MRRTTLLLLSAWLFLGPALLRADEPSAVQPIRQWYLRVREDVQSRILLCDTFELGRDLSRPGEPVTRVRYYYYDPGTRLEMGDEEYPSGPALISVDETNGNPAKAEEYLFGKNGKLLFYYRETGGQEPERIYFQNDSPFYFKTGEREQKIDRNRSGGVVRNAKLLLEAWTRLQTLQN